MEPHDLQLKIEDYRVIVSAPGTSFRASFSKAENEPRLVQSLEMSVEMGNPSQHRKDFEALAWDAANAKARELGWI